MALTPRDGFSDVELVVGSVLALRVWNIDCYGRLRGQFRQVWRPGENVATCLQSPGLPHLQAQAMLGLPVDVFGDVPPSRHTVPAEHCGCGFWAYTEVDDFVFRPTGEAYEVVGVAECYGNMLCGVRGVRCGKARIVAVTRPERSGAEGRVRRNYPDVKVVEDLPTLVDAYPVEPAWEPTPDNDPHFWTRS